MRYVVKSDADKPPILASSETYQALLDIIRTRNKDLISERIYRQNYTTPDGARSLVEDKLAIAYKDKCAYCERICKADIEHYRPKKGVSGELHDGYYWLCYEWSNLIPSCINCNREGGKHNQFPVLGIRVNAPIILADGNLDLNACKASKPPLLNEVPFLLHPEVDPPEKYFKFEIDPNGEGIRIVGIDPEGRGIETINICLLNRKELKIDRVVNVIDDFKDSIHGQFLLLSNNVITELEFKADLIKEIIYLKGYSINEKKTHTLLRKYIVSSSSNFSEIVLPFIAPQVRSILYAAYIST